MGLPKDIESLFHAAARAAGGQALAGAPLAGAPVRRPAEGVLDRILARQGVVLLDGGFSGELEATLGRALDEVLWTAEGLLGDEGRAAVKRVHRGFLDAGADVLLTASYQASVEGFAQKGVPQEKAEECIAQSVRLARDVVGEWKEGLSCGPRDVVVAASVGPYAAALADGSEYAPSYTTAACLPDLLAFHRRRLAVLCRERPDYLAFETIPCAVEAAAVTALIQQPLADGIPTPPVWISFTVAPGGTTLRSGEALFAVAALVLAHDNTHRVAGVGVNCLHPEDTQGAVRILARARAAARRTDARLLCYPNLGRTWDGAEKRFCNDGVAVEQFARLAHEWRAAGADGIGGCCQCGADVIAALRSALVGEGGAGAVRVLLCERRVKSPTMAQQQDLHSLIHRNSGDPRPPRWITESVAALTEDREEYRALQGQCLSDRAWRAWEERTADTQKEDIRARWPVNAGEWTSTRTHRVHEEDLTSVMWMALQGQPAVPAHSALAAAGARDECCAGGDGMGLSLATLETLIRGVYESKAQHDAHCRDAGLPHQTMEQHTWQWLGMTRDSPHNPAQKNLLVALDAHKAQSNDVAVFAAIMASDADEDVRVVITLLKRRIESMVAEGVRRGLNIDGRPWDVLIRQKLAGSLRRDEWSEIVYTLYEQEDAVVVSSACSSKIVSYAPVRKRLGRISVPNPDAAHGCIQYADFVKICADYQLALHVKFLEPFVVLFRRHNRDGTGVLTDAEFHAVAQEVAPLSDALIATQLDLIDPRCTRRITFSDTVRALSRYIKAWMKKRVEEERINAIMNSPPSQPADT